MKTSVDEVQMTVRALKGFLLAVASAARAANAVNSVRIPAADDLGRLGIDAVAFSAVRRF